MRSASHPVCPARAPTVYPPLTPRFLPRTVTDAPTATPRSTLPPCSCLPPYHTTMLPSHSLPAPPPSPLYIETPQPPGLSCTALPSPIPTPTPRILYAPHEPSPLLSSASSCFSSGELAWSDTPQVLLGPCDMRCVWDRESLFSITSLHEHCANRSQTSTTHLNLSLFRPSFCFKEQVHLRILIHESGSGSYLMPEHLLVLIPEPKGFRGVGRLLAFRLGQLRHQKLNGC
jgi:hypothetical protein